MFGRIETGRRCRVQFIKLNDAPRQTLCPCQRNIVSPLRFWAHGSLAFPKEMIELGSQMLFYSRERRGEVAIPGTARRSKVFTLQVFSAMIMLGKLCSGPHGARHSQSGSVFFGNTGLRKAAFPRSHDRGPIEASISRAARRSCGHLASAIGTAASAPNKLPKNSAKSVVTTTC